MREAAAHIDGGGGFDRAAQAGHADRHKLQPFPIKFFVNGGFDLQRTGQRLLFLRHLGGQPVGADRLHGAAGQALGQAGHGVCLIEQGKDGERHTKLLRALLRHGGERGQAGNGGPRPGADPQYLAGGNALIIVAQLPRHQRGSLHQVRFPLPGLQGAHGPAGCGGIGGGGQHAEGRARKGHQHQLVPLPLGAQQLQKGITTGAEDLLPGAVIHCHNVADGFPGGGKIAGGDLFVPHMDLHPGGTDQGGVQRVAVGIGNVDEDIHLRHVEIDLLNGKAAQRGSFGGAEPAGQQRGKRGRAQQPQAAAEQRIQRQGRLPDVVTHRSG